MLGVTPKPPPRIHQEQLIHFELAYINTNHPDFVDIGQVLGTTFVGQEPPVAAPRQPQPAPQQQPVRTPPWLGQSSI